ncbi:MAG: hypothetical protein QOE77_3299 [Blastocatellia bacterium]|jgi:hypothetical protein|nr:hypothetical protein [Blastocatellia bacterium]
MRPLPVLRHDDFVYSRLKALAWVTNGTGLPTLLQANAGRAVAHIIEHDEPTKPLVLDCKGIGEVDDHALENARTLLQNQQRPLVLLNAGAIDASIKRELGEYSLILIGGMPVYILGDDTIDRGIASRFIQQAKEIVDAYVATHVKECFQKYEGGRQRMASTPLLASGVFDARPLISDPLKFVWISLLMADGLEDFLDRPLEQPQSADEANKPTRHFRLLAVSLRGSPLAAAVGLLSGRHKTIEIVDHMGPKYKILEEPSLRSTAVEEDYIYVGDFVIGGTELRIAQAYARSKGSRIKHAVVIGRMLETAEYNLDFDITSLVNLHECSPNERFVFLDY